MTITELEIPDVKVLEPNYSEDFRGYSSETYSERTFAEHGLNTVFVQDYHSLSIKKGTIRALHFQNNPKPQTKIVRCIKGSILDVSVDLRKGSPTYKKWISIVLSGENRKQLWIPPGFAHGFMTLEDNCEVVYKMDEFYFPELARAILYNDPEIGIMWGKDIDAILSEKDITAPLLKNSDVNFNFF